MAWRTLGRFIAVAVPGGALLAGWLVYQALNGAAVRAQVIAQLRGRFVGADVSLGSASFRLLGGVTFDNLTLFRRDDKSQTPILHVPAGVIYHDKELLASGKLAIRKIKFERPRLTVARITEPECDKDVVRWNVEGILGPVHPDVAIPIIEIEQGTIAVSRPADATTPAIHVEVHNVSGTLVNNPLAILRFDGRGDAGPYGTLAVQGTWHRTEQHLSFNADLTPIPLGQTLVRELTRFAPAVLEPIEHVDGTGRVYLEMSYRPDATPHWRHQARFEIVRGRLRHRNIPFPIERLDLAGRWNEGQVTLDRISALAGSSAVNGRIEFVDSSASAVMAALTPAVREPRSMAIATMPSVRMKEILQASFDMPQTNKKPPMALSSLVSTVKRLDLSVGKLPVSPDLFAQLPPQFQRINARFAPVGPLDVTWTLNRLGTSWSAGFGVRANGVTGRFEDFPYQLDNVHGRVDWSSANDKPEQLVLDLTAEAPGRKPVTIRGSVDGDGPDPSFAYDITGDDLVIDETLVGALPAKFQSVAHAFHAQGRADAAVTIRHERGEGPARQRYRIRFRDSLLRYDAFPYPLDGVSGVLDIHLGSGAKGETRPAYVFAFDDFRGRRNGGDVAFRGVARPGVNGTQIDLNIEGRNVALDAEMSAAFSRMKLLSIWEVFGPSGRMNFNASVSHKEIAGEPAEFDIRVAPAGASIRPSFFPYALTGLNGWFRLTRGKVELGEFRAQHGATELRIGSGEVLLPENGGYHTDVRDLRLTPLPVDTAFVAALPPALQSVCRALEPNGTLAIQARQLVVDAPSPVPGPPMPPVIYWDGNVAFAGATLKAGVDFSDLTGVVACHGRYRGQLVEGVEGHIALDRATVVGQPLENVHAALLVRGDMPQVLQLPNVSATLFGGRVGGEGRVAFGAGLQYELDLKGVELDVTQFAQRNRIGHNAQLSGKARAELYVKGTGAGVSELEGGGSIHVPNGRLYNLPLVLDVLKLPNLHAPDGTAFEEAHTSFRIRGGRVDVERIDLIGSAISLGGRGELNLDGSNTDLELYAVWGHIVQVLPPGLRDVPPWLSKNLLRIRARGRLGGQLDFATEPVPGITQPVKRLLEAARGRQPAAGVVNR